MYCILVLTVFTLLINHYLFVQLQTVGFWTADPIADGTCTASWCSLSYTLLINHYLFVQLQTVGFWIGIPGYQACLYIKGYGLIWNIGNL
jgi:hypothetical protein